MWRPDHDALIRQNYNQPGGLTSAQIGAAIGKPKGSVITRARYLGVAASRKHPPRLAALRLHDDAPPAPPVRRTRAKAPRATTIQSTSPFRTCQWIYGEVSEIGHAKMCGAPTKPGRSWCPDHCKRVFVSPGAEADEARAEG